MKCSKQRLIVHHNFAPVAPGPILIVAVAGNSWPQCGRYDFANCIEMEFPTPETGHEALDMDMSTVAFTMASGSAYETNFISSACPWTYAIRKGSGDDFGEV